MPRVVAGWWRSSTLSGRPGAPFSPMPSLPMWCGPACSSARAGRLRAAAEATARRDAGRGSGGTGRKPARSVIHFDTSVSLRVFWPTTDVRRLLSGTRTWFSAGFRSPRFGPRFSAAAGSETRPGPPPEPLVSDRGPARRATGSQLPGCIRGRVPPGRRSTTAPAPKVIKLS